MKLIISILAATLACAACQPAPEGTQVAHKTGTSGYENGMAAATNDVGLIQLPDGRRLAIAVLVTDAKADETSVEHTIAAIARACYDAAVKTTP